MPEAILPRRPFLTVIQAGTVVNKSVSFLLDVGGINACREPWKKLQYSSRAINVSPTLSVVHHSALLSTSEVQKYSVQIICFSNELSQH